MIYRVQMQESYSRGLLLLRLFFGALYIGIPHAVCLALLGMGAWVVGVLTFFAILFTGKYPEGFFHFVIQLQRWNTRVMLSLFNLTDLYPPFGLQAEFPPLQFEVPYIQQRSRGMLLVKVFFGSILILPHIVVLYLRILGLYFVTIFNFFHILFTGRCHPGAFSYTVGTLRWMMRVNLYLGHITDEYPPFTGKELAEEVPSAEQGLY